VSSTMTGAMLSRERKIELVESCLRRPSVQDARVEAVIHDGWAQTIHRAVRSPLSNRVWFSVLEPDRADARIASTIETYRALDLPVMWMVSPSSRPHDLGDRLLAHGFRLCNVADGLIIPMESILTALSSGLEPSVTVEVVGEHNLGDWIEVQAVGWGMAPDARASALDKARFRLAQGESRFLDFLGRVGGIPCGSGSVDIREDDGFLKSGVVSQEYRSRGVLRAMMVAQATVLKGRGIRHATAHALKDTSAPILLRMGFEAVCEIAGYCYP
jgi:GNAT superfamily N-acetyltransferase